MSPIIIRDDARSRDGRSIIRQSEDFMRSFFPPEECFTMSPEELANADSIFYIARESDQPIGCVALVKRKGYAEIKRLFVTDDGRGLGLGRQLMEKLESDAKEGGVRMLRLETGLGLEAATRLYLSLDYKICPSFGDYGDVENSLFMEKFLG